MNANLNHEYWMRKAIELAKEAASCQEVPIGAVVVDENNQLLGKGFNQSIGLHDPTAHAEILAIRQACRVLKNYRLSSCRLYVTAQPCLMCLTTALHARLNGIFFGIFSEKKWPMFPMAQKAMLWNFWNTSELNVFPQNKEPTLSINSTFIGSLELRGNLLASECLSILQKFFSEKRKR